VIKRILYISIISTAAAFLNIALAQQAEPDRDPFFSTGRISSETTSVPRDNDWGRDPFSRPFEGKGQTLPAPLGRIRGKNLTGIIYSNNIRYAIIGGEAVREGSMIGDQKLVDVRKRSVILMNGGGSREEVFLEDFSIRK